MKKNVLDWLEDTVAKHPRKIAYKSLSQSMSFIEVEEKAKRIGCGIAAINTSKEPVAILLDKEVTTIAAFLGVVYSGRAYAPIDISLPDSRIISIFSCLQPTVVITKSKYMKRIQSLCESSGDSATIIDIDDLTQVEINEEYLFSIRNRMIETDPLYIIFTSGSSGVPKGVITSHHSLMCYIEAYVKIMGIDSNDRLGNQAPLDYIAAIRDIYIPLYKASSTFLIPKNYFMQINQLADIISEQKITVLGWSASALVLLTALGFLDDYYEDIKKICFSGSVMPSSILRKWQKVYPDALFVNQYGPTEATASCTYYVIDHLVEENEIIPIGVPYENYKIIVVKEDGSLAGFEEKGEICIGGPALALGYYRNLEKTHKDFIQNPANDCYEERIYKTGDIGVLKADGLLYFHGRKDRQVKMMGHRVELDEIEVVVSTISSVNENSVVYNHEKETIWLFYSGEASTKEIVMALRKQLPGFMIPRKIVQMDCLPKLPNGKTDLTALRQITEKE